MELLSLVRRVQNNDDDKAMVDILQMFEPKIRKSLSTIQRGIKEDYRQEIYIRIIKAIRKYDLDSTPDLIGFCSKLRNLQKGRRDAS